MFKYAYLHEVKISVLNVFKMRTNGTYFKYNIKGSCQTIIYANSFNNLFQV